MTENKLKRLKEILQTYTENELDDKNNIESILHKITCESRSCNWCMTIKNSLCNEDIPY